MTNGVKRGLLLCVCVCVCVCVFYERKTRLLKEGKANEHSYNYDQRKPGEGRSPSKRTKSDMDRRGAMMRGKRFCCNVVETVIN